MNELKRLLMLHGALTTARAAVRNCTLIAGSVPFGGQADMLKRIEAIDEELRVLARDLARQSDI